MHKKDRVKDVQYPDFKVFWGIYICLDSPCTNLCLNCSVNHKIFKIILKLAGGKIWV